MNEGIYIVLVQEDYVRNAQIFDPSGMTFDEFDSLDNLDMQDERYERRWTDISPEHYVGFTKAESSQDAIRKVADESGYDARILYAIRIDSCNHCQWYPN